MLRRGSDPEGWREETAFIAFSSGPGMDFWAQGHLLQEAFSALILFLPDYLQAFQPLNLFNLQLYCKLSPTCVSVFKPELMMVMGRVWSAGQGQGLGMQLKRVSAAGGGAPREHR